MFYIEGTFQLELAPSYIQDEVLRNGVNQLQVDELIVEPGFIRLRIFSRYRNRVKRQASKYLDNIKSFSKQSSTNYLQPLISVRP